MLQLFCSRQVPEEIRQFDVILEEPDHIYFCGEQISGHVKVDLAGCLTVQGMWRERKDELFLRGVECETSRTHDFHKRILMTATTVSQYCNACGVDFRLKCGVTHFCVATNTRHIEVDHSSKSLVLDLQSNRTLGMRQCLWNTQLTYLLHGAVILEKLTGFAANQEIPRILWNPKVHYCVC